MVQENTGEQSEEVPRKRLKFRCYKPQDQTLQNKQLKEAEAESIDDTVSNIIAESKSKPTEIDLNSLAPRKSNWDLKRDVEKKLARLEKRTKRSMAELIREKLKAEKDISVSAFQNDENDSD